MLKTTAMMLMAAGMLLAPSAVLGWETPAQERARELDGLTIKESLAELQTPDGQARVLAQLDQAALNYCRSYPPGMKTVSVCRREIRAVLIADLAEKVRGLRAQRPPSDRH